MNTNVIERQCASCKHCIEIANGAYVCDLYQKRIALNGENKRGWITRDCNNFVDKEELKKISVSSKTIPHLWLIVLLFIFILWLLYFWKGGEIWLWNF